MNLSDVIKNKYCSCKSVKGVYTEDDGWGYWYVCDKCNLRIDGEYHYYNHFDGEDHDDIDI